MEFHIILHEWFLSRMFFNFPCGSLVEASKKLPKRSEQALPLRLLPLVQALVFQGCLNFLIMDNFYTGIRKMMQVSLRSTVSNCIVRVVRW